MPDTCPEAPVTTRPSLSLPPAIPAAAPGAAFPLGLPPGLPPGPQAATWATSGPPMSIGERLARDRILFVNGVIDDRMAHDVVAHLFFLESVSQKEDIYLYVNSPGGSINSGLAIFDAMEYVACDIVTVAIGLAASMGAFLVACGTPGKRIALRHSTLMIHQPLYGYQGQSTDMEIHVRHVVRMRGLLNGILAERTGRDISEIERDTDRDRFMTADEARDYGLVDTVAARRSADR